VSWPIYFHQRSDCLVINAISPHFYRAIPVRQGPSKKNLWWLVIIKIICTFLNHNFRGGGSNCQDHVITVCYYGSNRWVLSLDLESVSKGLLSIVPVSSRQQMPSNRNHTQQSQFSWKAEPAESARWFHKQLRVSTWQLIGWCEWVSVDLDVKITTIL